jgi:hypothetical protein
MVPNTCTANQLNARSYANGQVSANIPLQLFNMYTKYTYSLALLTLALGIGGGVMGLRRNGRIVGILGCLLPGCPLRFEEMFGYLTETPALRKRTCSESHHIPARVRVQRVGQFTSLTGKLSN